MFGRKKRHIELTAERLQAIRAAVEAPDARTPVDAKPEASCLASPHLSDAEFVSLCLDAPSDEIGQERLAHLAQCPECTAEWKHLQNLGEIWQDSVAVERLEARRNAALKAAEPGRVAPVRRPRISLAPLIPPQTAYAAHEMPGPESITLPVYEAGAPVSGLIAALQRRSHEYYALITPTDSEAVALYGERSVVLTIAGEQGHPPILRREIGIGVAVLLGTHLPLTAASSIQADLTPPSS